MAPTLVERGSHVRPLIPPDRSPLDTGFVVEPRSHGAGEMAPSRMLVRGPLVHEVNRGRTDGSADDRTRSIRRDVRSQGTLGRGLKRHGVRV